MSYYLVALPTGALAAVSLLAAALSVFADRGTLPPPQISNGLCMDEKLAWMRDNPPKNVTFLVLGSSVAWRHFNSIEAKRLDRALRPYNAGLCGSNIAQTERVSAWLTARVHGLETVLLIASPIDFGGCRDESGWMFDMKEADKFVFGGGSTVPYYLKFFDPSTLLFNFVDLKRKRSDITGFNSIVINRYGDGPMEPPQARDMFYFPATFEMDCFVALRRMAIDLRRKQIAMNVTVAPLHPKWLRKFDANGEITRVLDRHIRDALQGTGAHWIPPDPTYPERAFFDAIHLRWSSTPRFTRSVVVEATR